MGDDIPSLIQCPILSSSNYVVWAIKMKVILRLQEVWETIERVSTDSEKNDIAIGLLFQAIPDTLMLQIGDKDSPKEIWEAIKSSADHIKEARLPTLMSEFDRLKMADTEKIGSFAGKLSELASKSAALGQVIEESKLVKKFIISLPRRFIQIVAVLEQILDLNATGFEDVVDRLKAYEARVFGEENREDTQIYQAKEKKDRSKVVCFRCDKLGHFASACPERILNR